jgi:hypothetical protein
MMHLCNYLVSYAAALHRFTARDCGSVSPGRRDELNLPPAAVLSILFIHTVFGLMAV